MLNIFRKSAKPADLWKSNLTLLICILLLFIIGPSFARFYDFPLFSTLFFTLLIISARSVLDFAKESQRLMDILGIVIIILLWIDFITGNEYRSIGIAAFLLLSLFLLLTTILLVYHIAKSEKVNANIIFCSINGYLLLGILGAVAYVIVDLIHPESLSIDVAPSDGIDTYVYFSYVTLSTLGYGDISPTMPASRSISIFLSITGQLYMTILIAMLVGKFLSSKQSNNK